MVQTLTSAKEEEREDSQDKDENFFLISNMETEVPKELQDHYDYRWPIELMFKDMKQLFGWEDLSFKSSLAVLCMIYLSFIAYTVAIKEKVKQEFKSTIGNICDFFRKLSLRETIKKAFVFGRLIIVCKPPLLPLESKFP